LIVAPDCHWSRHTQIGDAYRVSTIGDYRRRVGHDIGPRQPVGSGANEFYETMVFRTTPDVLDDSEGCGCHVTTDWTELVCDRYATAGEATAGHEAYVRQFADQLEDAQ
jgi:hypothetical protein